MKTPVTIRRAQPADADALAELYRGTIRTINRCDYSDEQVAAWSGRSRNTESLLRRIGEQYFLVAENASGKLTGFASITADGSYLDFMYVHREHQGEGVAGDLYGALEIYAREQKSDGIESDVSITARPFFEHQGFTALFRQEVPIDGVILHNFRMRKELTY